MIKKIFKKLLGIPPKPQAKRLNYLIGINTEFNGTVDKRAEQSFVSIGNDCLISAYLVTNTPESRITIGNNVFIAGTTIIEAAISITVEDDVLISHNCLLQDSDNHSIRYSLRKHDTADWKRDRSHNWGVTEKKPIRISKGAWIGAKSIILKGVTVGVGSIVAAGSVVTKDVPDWTIVGGNPARTIREIPENER